MHGSNYNVLRTEKKTKRPQGRGAAVGPSGQSMRCSISSLLFHLCTFHLFHVSDTVTAHSFGRWAETLSRQLVDTFTEATKSNQIIENYGVVTEAETFDPRTELKKIKTTLERYLDERAKMAWDAKISLQGKTLFNYSDDEVNNPSSAKFIRYINAKSESDATSVHSDSRTSAMTFVNSTKTFRFAPNANFYGIETSREASAVHIPTPVYDRKLDVLQKIEWSDIDQNYQSNQERVKDLSFQMFCSEAGFMRYFPAAPWVWESKGEELDLFDCRSTEWYISGATMSKNMIIMLDLSGSMLGQRFEIAKQTIEAIMDTLSDNDYFNIMPFSKTAEFLDECTTQNTLIQATIRNKKYLRAKLDNVSSEGKAEYEKGLSKAFQTLMNLPGEVIFKRKEELLDGSEESRRLKEDPRLHFVHSEEHVLVVDREYLHAIGNYTGRERKLGCNNVIMLITDGAPGYYKEIFNLYNKDKKVRFFSFLIGEEAIDFDEVTWMACNNRGFMVHVSSMTDVQEKVQHYIKVMSRPLGRYASRIRRDQPNWSGVYKERLYLPRVETGISAEEIKAADLNSTLSGGGPPAKKKTRVTQLDAKSELFVTTVSYPVVVDGEFMGVSAVSIPIRELIQLTQVRNIGSRSYFFMLDKNGHVMFHPQLKPIDRNTKQVKPNYNNMDFLELEVPQNQKVARKAVINCDNTETFTMDILYANQDLTRVYPQTNDYYSECVRRAHFSIGMAVAKNDEVRIRRKTSLDYGKVDRDWFSGKRWRIHPKWRYCLLNDTDTGLSAEEAFQVYVKQMRDVGRLPELCKSRKALVDRVLLDGEATNELENFWDLNWEQYKSKGIHLVFFSTTSGFIKFHNQTLEDYFYEDPNYVEPLVEEIPDPRHKARKTPVAPEINRYEHFVLELNRKSMADPYFKRAVRMPEKIVFDVNSRTKLWYSKPTVNAYGNEENETLLVTATKALYLDQALLGVVGMEFVYDHLVNTMSNIGCRPSDDRLWCFLIDEHAFVVYSSQNNNYSGYFSPKGDSVIGKWFGHINRVTERTMSLLLKKNFYTVTTYVDYQAMCKDEVVVPVTASASRVASSLLRTLLWFLQHFVKLVTRVLPSLFWLEQLAVPGKAYTVSFQSNADEYPCDKTSQFYIANPTSRDNSPLIDEDLSDRPCKQSSAKCSVKLYASWVPNTNLLLVGIVQSSSSWCYDETQCPMSNPPDIAFGFAKAATTPGHMLSMSPTDPNDDMGSDPASCRHLVPPKLSSAANHCFDDEPIFDESEFPCSSADSASPFVFLVLFCIVVGRIVHP
uniref:VWFA domain-containing protein n=1 Tax=Steinernema glaseri TaxID=37863 RepID=A0A1I7XYD9_9BILA